jgi:hypothetical protein
MTVAARIMRAALFVLKLDEILMLYELLTRSWL